ncbi:MAG: hypothetical protein CMJ48_10395 [Planctomycetaceae bacterium]|nr:hypothetical protein [Planctomycetaceae bacterium]
MSATPERRFNEYEPLFLAGLLIIVVGSWLFIVLADGVGENDAESIDSRIVRAMRSDDDSSDPLGPRWLEEMGRDLTALGGYTVLTIVVVSVIVFLLLLGKHSSTHFVAASILSGYLVAMLLKEFYQRPRPDVVEHLSYVESSSFPSGHSMMSAIVYLTLGALIARRADRLALKIYILGVALLLTVLVGSSRVYMGVHYPTDVLAGWSAGLVWATFCCLIADRLQKRAQQSAENDSS